MVAPLPSKNDSNLDMHVQNVTSSKSGLESSLRHLWPKI